MPSTSSVLDWSESFRCGRAIVMAARHHKRICNDPDCGVSMHDLRVAAVWLASKLNLSEWSELTRLIQDTNWT